MYSWENDFQILLITSLGYLLEFFWQQFNTKTILNVIFESRIVNVIEDLADIDFTPVDEAGKTAGR